MGRKGCKRIKNRPQKKFQNFCSHYLSRLPKQTFYDIKGKPILTISSLNNKALMKKNFISNN